MNPSPAHLPRTWTARRWPDRPAASHPTTRPGEWRPLQCTWLPSSAPAALAPGRARLGWTPAALHLEAEFTADRPRNRALRLNERTWELGDVCELFLQLDGHRDYLEIHVTPENQRLQLRWPDGGLQRVRAKQAPLESYFVAQTDWVASSTLVAPGVWITRLAVPAVRLGVPELHPGRILRAAVCRYHYRPNRTEPELSSTAALAAAGFHQPAAWDTVTLAPAA